MKRDRDALKRKYAQFHDWLCARFYEWDPEGIGSSVLGPRDEYAVEASRILPLVPKADSPEKLAARMREVFDEMFGGSAKPVEYFVPLAAEAIERWGVAHE